MLKICQPVTKLLLIKQRNVDFDWCYFSFLTPKYKMHVPFINGMTASYMKANAVLGGPSPC